MIKNLQKWEITLLESVFLKKVGNVARVTSLLCKINQ